MLGLAAVLRAAQGEAVLTGWGRPFGADDRTKETGSGNEREHTGLPAGKPGGASTGKVRKYKAGGSVSEKERAKNGAGIGDGGLARRETGQPDYDCRFLLE